MSSEGVVWNRYVRERENIKTYHIKEHTLAMQANQLTLPP